MKSYILVSYKYLIIILLITFSLVKCTKYENSCNNVTGGNYGFKIYEFVLDTLLQTDTSFSNRDIVFKTNSTYSNISWSIGNDPRVFTTSSVSLRFLNPDILTIGLSAIGTSKNCVAEQFSVKKKMVLLNDDGSIKSPLVGYYKGFNTDKPNDTFSISIKFWFGANYPWWSKGVYSVDNLPRGYLDTTKNVNGIRLPEITGILASTGYKNIAIDKSGNLPSQGIKGYGSLKQGLSDTLIFSYKIIDTLKFSQTGQLNYLQKTFFGIKK